MKQKQFINAVFLTAEKLGFTLENSRTGLRQIDFGNKKLHEDHIRKLYPEILTPNIHIPSLIDDIAPGRPCTHKPMREIIEDMHQQIS